jgi:RHS repeat-associated protein
MLYDPILGKVLTTTGPNGIETCYTYDALGRQTSQTDRCGSTVPVLTTSQYFLKPSSGFAPPNSAVVTVTTAPTGVPAWSYLDDQGKTTGTLAYAFDGGFIETTTAYNALGQITRLAKPFHLSSTTDQASASYTVTCYDSFNRVKTVTDPLGIIDGSNSEKSTTINTTYDGSTAETDRLVNGHTQTRWETKNAIGKIASVTTQTELGPSTISYFYDADGDLTVTTDPGINSVLVGYDTRGRKISTIDPDMGSWVYVVDGFGDLVSQTDAQAQSTSMTYDRLSRMIGRTDASGTAQWVYDTAPGAGIGKLAAMVSAPAANVGTCAIPAGATVTGGQRAVKSFQYTAFGDVQEVDECADGASFVTSYQYDGLGRQSLIRYPQVNGNQQLAVGYHYTSVGYLQYLTDESSDYSVLWQAKAMNAIGQVIDEQMRNGVETASTRNTLTGWLLASRATAHADSDNVIQDWSYGFDELGNLLTRGRRDTGSGAVSSEAFGYDLTNRLVTAATTSGGLPHTESYGYDTAGLGNLTQKGVNAYTYGVGCQAGSRTAGPHAVCTVAGGTPFVYDGNGNLTSNGSRSATYNASNKVIHVESDPAVSQGNDTGSVDFMYGADGNRVVQTVTTGGVMSRTIYVGLGATGKSLYERVTTTKPGGQTKHVHFIYAGNVHGGNAFALRVVDASGGVSRQYYNFDHIGSVTAMSDDKGRVATAQASGSSATVFGYDAWGSRRNPDGTAANSASFDQQAGNREFTGQEQIPDVGLVNMNGRLYDPSLGRFLSPDPTVQFIANLQSYNRYSYAGNNPLRYTDPTGYFLDLLAKDIYKHGGDFLSSLKDPVNDFELLTTIAVCVPGGPACLLYGIDLALVNTTVAVSEGVPFDQAVVSSAIGLGIGLAAGEVGGDLKFNTIQSLVLGSASAAVSTGISNVLAGKSFFGWDMLTSAMTSAAAGAATLSLHQVFFASEASASTDHGGSGAAAVDAQARRPPGTLLAGDDLSVLNQRLWCGFCQGAGVQPLGIGDAFAHYLGGSGSTLSAPFSQLGAGSVGPEYFGAYNDAIAGAVFGDSNHISTSAPFSTHGLAAAVFGTVVLHLEGDLTFGSDGAWSFRGKISAYNDIYDFNPASHRTMLGEFSTWVGAQFEGTPYEIRFVGSQSVYRSGQVPEPPSLP